MGIVFRARRGDICVRVGDTFTRLCRHLLTAQLSREMRFGYHTHHARALTLYARNANAVAGLVAEGIGLARKVRGEKIDVD